ncbi:MAG: DUF2807 domain-containing protein [Cytophagales bacterium]
MKKITTTVLGILFFVIAEAQYQSERKFDTFEKLEVSDGIKVKIFNSDAHKVILNVSDMPETRVMTELSAYELSIKLETGIYEKGQVYAEVYVKNLKELTLKDNCNVSTDKALKGDALLINASTSSKGDLELDYNYTEISLSTSASLSLKGKSKIVDASSSTNASLKAYELNSENFKAKATTQGEIFVKTENMLDVQATTGGKVYYKGKPAHLKEKSNLGGDVVDAN